MTAGFEALRSALIVIVPVTPAKLEVCAMASRSFAPSPVPAR